MIGLDFIDCTIGYESHSYEGLPNISARIKELNLRGGAEVWGLGKYRKLKGELYTSVINCLKEGLGQNLRAGDADAVLCCLPNKVDPRQFTNTIVNECLPEIGVKGHIYFMGIALKECANVISAINYSTQLLRAGYQNVLIVAAEKIEPDSERLTEFALYSDFVFCAMVRSDLVNSSYLVIDGLDYMDAGHESGDSMQFGNLDKRLIADLLKRNNLAMADIAKYFSLNLHLPLANYKSRKIGFTDSQVSTETTVEVSHCYGVDPFINLKNYEKGHGKSEQLYVLNASYKRHASALVLKSNSSAASAY